MFNVPKIIFVLLACLVGFLGLVFLIAGLNRARIKRKPQLSGIDLTNMRAALLEVIKDNSADRRKLVALNGFWRVNGIRRHQRYEVVMPLIERNILVEEKERLANDFQDVLRDMWGFATYKAPGIVRLTDRTWEQMFVERVSGYSIVIEKVENMNYQHAEGPITQSPQTNAGRDAKVKIKSDERNESRGISVADVRALVAALRADEAQITEEEERGKVRSLAEKLDGEVGAKELDAEAIEDSVQRAERYVTRFGGMLNATSTILESWRKLRGE